jgi:hypothetical protein
MSNMILDDEQQRALLLQFIDSAPVSGPMGQILELAERVSALRATVAGAPIHIDPALDAMTER